MKEVITEHPLPSTAHHPLPTNLVSLPQFHPKHDPEFSEVPLDPGDIRVGFGATDILLASSNGGGVCEKDGAEYGTPLVI